MKTIPCITAAALSLLVACGAGAQTASAIDSNGSPTTPDSQTVPDHVAIVMFENHSYADVIGSAVATNFTALAAAGANFLTAPTDPGGAASGSHALRHPSQPNYMELYSGDTQGTVQDGRDRKSVV